MKKEASPNVPRKVTNSTVFGQANDQKFTFSEKSKDDISRNITNLDETEKTMTIDDEQVNMRQSKDTTLDKMMGNLGKK